MAIKEENLIHIDKEYYFNADKYQLILYRKVKQHFVADKYYVNLSSLLTDYRNQLIKEYSANNFKSYVKNIDKVNDYLIKTILPHVTSQLNKLSEA